MQEYARLSEDLEKLPPHREAKQAEQLLSSEIAGFERETQFKTAELQGESACSSSHSALDLYPCHRPQTCLQQQAHQAPVQS